MAIRPAEEEILGSFPLAGAWRGAQLPLSFIYKGCHLLRAYCARTGDTVEDKPNKDLHPLGVAILEVAWQNGEDVTALV